jgi:acyl-CoA thioester hydrolase
MTKVPATVADFPFQFWEEVRFRDLDSFGHVNNAVYATYLESARIAYCLTLTGEPLEQLGMILAEQTISYRAPAYFGDRLAIGVRVSSIGTKSLAMEYTIARVGDETVVAIGRSVMVAYDYTSGQSIPVPESFRAAVLKLQGPLRPQ